MSAPPELRTERLRLRPFAPSDREPFAAINADPDVMRYLQGPRSLADTDDTIARIEAVWAERGWGLWAVEVLPRASEPGAAFIGYVGLWPADFLPSGPAVEIGWRLARAHWGRRYAPEGARAALRFGFEVAGLAEIVSFTVPDNRASWRVMEQLGMVRNPARDFDHPNVDPARHPELVRHVVYELRAPISDPG